MSDNNENKAANWQERLTKSRRLRGAGKGASVSETPRVEVQPSAAVAVKISVEDVLNTANLNDRMELARVRHAQILAERKAKNPPSPVAEETRKKRRDTFRFAQAKQPATDADIPVMAPPISTPNENSEPQPHVQSEPEKTQDRPDVLVPAPLAPPSIQAQQAEAAADEELPEKKGRAVGLVWAGLAVAAMLAIALLGPFREMLFPDPSVGQLAQSDAVNQDNDQIAEQLSNSSVSGDIVLVDTIPDVPDKVDVALHQTFDLAGFTNDISLPIGFELPSLMVASNRIDINAVGDVAPSSELGEAVPVYVTKPIDKEPTSAEIFAGLGFIPDLELPNNWGQDIAAPLRPPHMVSLTNSNARRVSGGKSIVRSRTLSLPEASPLSPMARQNNPKGLNLLLLPEAPGRGLAGGANSASFTPTNFQFPTRIINQQAAIATPIAASLTINVSAPLPFDSSIAEGGISIGNLVIHAPASMQKSGVDSLISGLAENGFDVGPARLFNFTIRKTNVRYFHAADAEAARAVSDVVGGAARDFTSFRPSPPIGTVEVWLAGNTVPRPVSRRNTGSAPAQNPALLDLQNRLINSLKAGDHL